MNKERESHMDCLYFVVKVDPTTEWQVFEECDWDPREARANQQWTGPTGYCPACDFRDALNGKEQ
jgi:hypothetical protein